MGTRDLRAAGLQVRCTLHLPFVELMILVAMVYAGHSMTICRRGTRIYGKSSPSFLAEWTWHILGFRGRGE